ncbi:aspartate aminotransferase family protein [Pseudohoeflea coraliihabitans]|uniref:Acetylornithine aminotransferase n=1 Tax=Pseudohoeflea coraliihabitans TaxID=2860393 RepID=A0ABS6WNG0_9HYPH|nr:aspartate aminotransferase family protein [Pseudohoeflea sp. DP4N28-3]MBW3097491.1 aspartate aminotransferase family protein [Pseudohoeflea sp. DP4N28-3]
MANTAPLFTTYSRTPLRFERGEGVWLFDEKGARYLDFAAGIAVNSLGHAHPHLVAALTGQAQKLWHLSNLYEIPGQERLAERLVAATFADSVFFTNSGAEALECAIKTARRHFYVNGQPERVRIITMEGAFHGRTLATIAAGGQAKYLEGFGPKAVGFDQVPFGDIEALTAALDDTAAAVLIEPVQGEGGIRPLDPDVLRQIRALCDDHGVLLILDEVQSGIGRTGRLFAHEWAGITPDLMAIAKGIGGGFPLGACLATDAAADGMTPGTHGTTFGGNPLAMAVGNAVLDVVLADGFLDQVQTTGNALSQGLLSLKERYPGLIADIRGTGLMLGIRCVGNNGEMVQAFRNESLLTVPAGDNVVRLLPPLTVTAEEARDALRRMEAALEMIAPMAKTN